jgi:diacylglycerol kinase (ATP)
MPDMGGGKVVQVMPAIGFNSRFCLAFARSKWLTRRMHGTIHLFEHLPQVDDAQASGEGAGTYAAPVRSEPLVGLIRNPRSHGHARAADPGEGLPGVITAAPAERGQLAQILADFAARQVDYIAIDGGDGTVRDVLTCGAGVFGDIWPTLILLPSGKTNALAYDLGVPPGWTVAQALEAARRDSAAVRCPLVIAHREDERTQVRGFVLGAGAFTRAISLGQDAHRYGAFNAAAVGVTAVWSLLQALFGRRGNPWRRGTRMRLRDSGGQDLAHRGGLPDSERYLLFASSLERFAAGLKPFGNVQAAVRMAVLDNARFGLLVRLPMIFWGRLRDADRNKGCHIHGLDEFGFDIADKFILDGEAFPPGSYRVFAGPRLRFIVP